jgi:hypothetical protein
VANGVRAFTVESTKCKIAMNGSVLMFAAAAAHPTRDDRCAKGSQRQSVTTRKVAG